MAVVLSAPWFGNAYVFDDFSFLARAQTFRLTDLLPQAGYIFYRPVSREVYFGLLNLLSPGSPYLGHVVNGLVLGVTVWLTGRFAQRLIGGAAGGFAALLLAAFAQTPVLIAWVCGSQDLFAMVFVALALNFELQRKGGKATFSLALAVLSKETVVVVLPAFALVRWLGSRSKKEALLACLRLGLLAASWVIFHPGIRILLGHGWTSPTGGYIGFHNPDRWASLLRSIPVLFNLPLTGYPSAWMGRLNLVAGIAAALLFVSWVGLPRRSEGEPSGAMRPGLKSILLLGALLAIPPVLLTSLLVQRWGPYYMCLSAIGVVLPLGYALDSIPRRIAGACLVAFFLLGLWCRGVKMDPKMQTEMNLAPAGRALLEVESNFKRVAPTLPHSAVVYVTTMATGSRSIYVHMYYFQALRVWYRDPSIQVLRPELRMLSSSPERLFFIDQALNVFAVDPTSLAVNSSGASLEPWRYRNLLRSWAIGLAASGEEARAVQVLLGPNPAGVPPIGFDRRVAAMLLAWRHEPAAANALLEGAPPETFRQAIVHVASLLTVPTRGDPLDGYALTAFGLPRDDPAVLRVLLGTLMKYGYYEPSRRIAERLLALQPGQKEAIEALRKVDSIDSIRVLVTPPIPVLDVPGG